MQHPPPTQETWNSTEKTKLLKHTHTHYNLGYRLEKDMATHSSILTWRIPWTEEPGGLEFMGSQRVGHNCVTNTYERIF